MFHTQQLIKSLYMQTFMSVSPSVSNNYNALFVLIMISNTRSKGVNDSAHARKKYVYLQIFMFVDVAVIKILLFNQKMKQNMKNMADL